MADHNDGVVVDRAVAAAAAAADGDVSVLHSEAGATPCAISVAKPKSSGYQVISSI